MHRLLIVTTFLFLMILLNASCVSQRGKEMREQAPMVMFPDADGNPWVPASDDDDSTPILPLGDPRRLLKRCTPSTSSAGNSWRSADKASLLLCWRCR